MFRAADARFLNLEQVMSDAGSDDVEYSQMARSYPKLIDDLQWARVTTVGPNLAEAQNINRLRWNSYVGKRD